MIADGEVYMYHLCYSFSIKFWNDSRLKRRSDPSANFVSHSGFLAGLSEPRKIKNTSSVCCLGAVHVTFGFFFFFSPFWRVAFQRNAIPSHWPVTKWFTCDHKWSASCTVGNSHPDISMTRIGSFLPPFQGCVCEHGCCICFISPVLKWTSDKHFKPWLYCNSALDTCSKLTLLLHGGFQSSTGLILQLVPFA